MLTTLPRDVELTFNDLLAGMGGSSSGLVEAGWRGKLAMNHWQTAMDSHAANHPTIEHLTADVTGYPMRFLPRALLLWASVICFRAGTQILTDQGLKPIEDVKVGDRVLTHTGQWKPVTKTMVNTGPTITVKGHGHPGLETTAEHPFYARRSARVWNNEIRDYRRQYEEPQWVPAAELAGQHWATPRTFGEPLPIPAVPGRGAEFTERFWWMVGRWLGDGFLTRIDREPDRLPKQPRLRSQPAGSPCVICGEPARPHGNSTTGRVSPYCSHTCKRAGARPRKSGSEHKVFICCGRHEAEELGAALDAIAPPAGPRATGGELRWTRSKSPTAAVFITAHQGLAQWLEDHFGRHAGGRRLPAWALIMPEQWRRALLDGYVSADGNLHRGTTTTVRCSTVSKQLAIGIRLLAVSLGHVATLYLSDKRTSGVIEGRQVTMRPSWTVTWTKDPSPAHAQHTTDEMHLWTAVKQVSPAQESATVYNLSVADDESYIADGIVVHNCTEVSPAGGRVHPTDQVDLFEVLDQLGDDDDAESFKALTPEAFERTRATAWCVVRACEAKRFPYVVIENVVEFAQCWVLFKTWVRAMTELGYEAPQILCATSAHVGDDDNLRAPQWRDRVYVVFRLKGMPKPDLEPRPAAFCFECGKDVRAKKAWFDPRVRVGKYRRDYNYRCPNVRCRHAEVEPYVRPAASVINWDDLGQRIGDRKKPLAPTTMDRIRAGLAKFPHTPSSITLNHGKDGTDRAFAVADRPFTTRTIKQGEALLVPTGGSWNTACSDVAEPMRTRLTRESEALVTVDPEPFVITYRQNANPAPATEPVTAVTAQGNHHGLVVPGGPVPPELRNALVIPYRKAAVKTAAEPVHTLSTRDSAALLNTASAVEDCYFRMLKPREQLGAQRFPHRTIVVGNQAEQTMQAGNAVSVNVARHIGERIKAAL
ncbi:DNA cytosine methyltransferase [Streptomyces sp. NPDC058691]|uniref:DNA cytosine methyltransferase n=1 Tax=Streptomyces sp. NPDC058691 TaxID=3346601 RepID=UPI0036642FB6